MNLGILGILATTAILSALSTSLGISATTLALALTLTWTAFVIFIVLSTCALALVRACNAAGVPSTNTEGVDIVVCRSSTTLKVC